MCFTFPTFPPYLFSVNVFIHYQGCYFHSEGKICTLAFPDFTTDGYIDNQFYIILPPTTISPQFSSVQAPLHSDYTDSPFLTTPIPPIRKNEHFSKTSTSYFSFPPIDTSPEFISTPSLHESPSQSQPHNKQTKRGGYLVLLPHLFFLPT